MLLLKKTPTEVQRRYLECPADEILFGGSLGGGKSTASVLDAYIEAMKNPGIVIGLFRRTLPELTNTLIREALETFPPESYQFREAKRRMTMFNGSELRFNFIDTDKDLIQYQGQEFDMIIMDEAANFTEYQLIRIKERVRSSRKGIRTKIRYLTNPMGVGKGYLKRRFIDDKEPYKIYVSPETKDQPKELQRTLCYIPARLTDNKYLYLNDPSYCNSLKELPDDIYKAMVDGDWDSKVGSFYPQFQSTLHTCLTYHPSVKDQLFLSMDWGTNKPFSVNWIALTQTNHAFVYREYYGSTGKPDEGINLTARECGKRLYAMCKEEFDNGLSYKYLVLDSSCWNRTGYGKTIAEILQEELKEIPIIKASKERINGWENQKAWLEIDYDDSIFNPYFKKPWLIISRKCPNLIKQFQDAVYSDTKPGDQSEKIENHSIENLRYWCMSRPQPKSPSESKYKPNQWGYGLDDE